MSNHLCKHLEQCLAYSRRSSLSFIEHLLYTQPSESINADLHEDPSVSALSATFCWSEAQGKQLDKAICNKQHGLELGFVFKSYIATGFTSDLLL